MLLTAILEVEYHLLNSNWPTPFLYVSQIFAAKLPPDGRTYFTLSFYQLTIRNMFFDTPIPISSNIGPKYCKNSDEPTANVQGLTCRAPLFAQMMGKLIQNEFWNLSKTYIFSKLSQDVRVWYTFLHLVIRRILFWVRETVSVKMSTIFLANFGANQKGSYSSHKSAMLRKNAAWTFRCCQIFFHKTQISS